MVVASSEVYSWELKPFPRSSPMRHVLKPPLRALGGLAVLAGLFLGLAAPLRAYPVFARKYQTSCQTCHTIFPKLNPFGQAFRLNGYRMPEGDGGPGQAGAVSPRLPRPTSGCGPNAVYPSHLPGNVPFALNVKMANVYASSLRRTAGPPAHPQRLPVPAGSEPLRRRNPGQDFSFFGEVTYGESADGGSEHGDRARAAATSTPRSAPSTSSTSRSASSRPTSTTASRRCG